MTHMNDDNMFWQLMICHGSGDAVYFDDNSFISASELMNVQEKAQLPIFLSVACGNGSYDSDINSEIHYPRSFAEGLIRSPGAGIAYIGGARSNGGFPVWEVEDGNLDYVGMNDTYALLYYFMDAYREIEEPTIGKLYKASKDVFLLEQTMVDSMNIAAYLRLICHGVSGVELPVAPELVEADPLAEISSDSYIDTTLGDYAVLQCEPGEDPVYTISDDHTYDLMTIVPLMEDVTITDDINGSFTLEDVSDAARFLNRIEREDGCERWHYSVVFNGIRHLDGMLYDWEQTDIIGTDHANDIEPSCFDLQRIYSVHDQANERIYMSIRLAEDYLMHLQYYGFLWLMIAFDDIEGQGFTGNINENAAFPRMCYVGFDNAGIDNLMILCLNGYAVPGFLYPGYGSLEWHVRPGSQDNWIFADIDSDQLLAYVGEECVEMYFASGLLQNLESARVAVFTTEYMGVMDDVVPSNPNSPSSPEVGIEHAYSISDYLSLLGNDPVDSDVAIPYTNSLGANFPNPFNPSTLIPFTIQNQGLVSLNIYNIQGQLVETLVDSELNSGQHAVLWNGESSTGVPVSSGIYFYRLQTGNYQAIRKMTFIK